jgi:mRNA interferase MazF
MLKKDFDGWNKIKKAINDRVHSWDFFYHEREVWWCSTGLNVAVETDGKPAGFERPVLVVRKFNKDMFWGVPLTGKEKNGPFYLKINHENGASWAMLSQLKTFSSKRLQRKIGMIGEQEFAEVQQRLYELLFKSETSHKARFLGGRSH